MPDKFTPRVHLEGVTFNINDTCVNAPIVIGGDYHNHVSDDMDVADKMQCADSGGKQTKNEIQGKNTDMTQEEIKSDKPNNKEASVEKKDNDSSSKTKYFGKDKKKMIQSNNKKIDMTEEEIKSDKPNNTKASVGKNNNDNVSNKKEFVKERNKLIQSIHESDNWECNHCDFKELESGDYCKNGNELDGVFCNTCKKEFVSTLSKDKELSKHQWKPGLGSNLVHACLKVYQCGLAYCNDCWLKKLIDDDSKAGNGSVRTRRRR